MIVAVWIDMIRGLTPHAGFRPPASDAAIRDCERALGDPLGDDLAALLRETNGVTGEYDLGLIWPVERVAADNITFRTTPEFADLYMPFDALLFFADAGNGDQFAFVLRDGRKDVFAWDHETDSRSWVAPDLAKYLTWWLDGTIKL
jgi:SMI1-KNR4 cell-wall